MSVRVKALTKKQLATVLPRLSDAGWKVNAAETVLTAKFPQPSYVSGLVFIARVVVHAEIADHHPDITYTYSAVTVKLTTHDVKGLTKKDIDLAKSITRLAQSSS